MTVIGLVIFFAIWSVCFWLDMTGRMRTPAAHWILGAIAGAILCVPA